MAIPDYRRIEAAMIFLADRLDEQPTLVEVAARAGLSEYHFQRLFRRWVGLSPKRYLQVLTARRAAALLLEPRSVLDAAYGAGLSGPGRLHDLMVTVEAVTPGEFKRRGGGVTVRWGIHPGPFGHCLIGQTDRGVCALTFFGPRERAAARADLAARWPEAALVEDARATARTAARIFGRARGGRPVIDLHVRGSNFQIKVWEALLRVPPGAVVTYGDLARDLGRPRASRAVGSAVARNPISFLIPCHRVIRASGLIGDYRWGTAKKRLILGWEAARAREAAGGAERAAGGEAP
ncbi:MAG: methylated-DNA--[protein]-cysteine S-methyltransferase [Candidatus Krumholzibacteriota bacterium]|nr:methylated-DNA--[protein]-cysteine S-methyltransferase [Candidatus Krumholzibacteriota bacterium]